MYSIQAGGQLLTLEQPRVMGILNITPDSFYAPSRMHSVHDALKKSEEMLMHSASILDVGGYSSRPGASDIPAQEEIKRVVPVIEALKKEFPQVIISIDTFRPEVAVAAIQVGAGMINDISGNASGAMTDVLLKNNVAYVCMNMRGTPQTMQSLTQYHSFMADVFSEIYTRIQSLRELGIGNIIADPGFGFAKTIDQNYELAEKINHFHCLGLPVLAGISRKSFIYKKLNISPEDALPATLQIQTQLLEKGVHILRTHDVAETMQGIKTFLEVQKTKKPRTNVAFL